jgi:hypothetical protein
VNAFVAFSQGNSTSLSRMLPQTPDGAAGVERHVGAALVLGPPTRQSWQTAGFARHIPGKGAPDFVQLPVGGSYDERNDDHFSRS